MAKWQDGKGANSFLPICIKLRNKGGEKSEAEAVGLKEQSPMD